MFKQRAISGNLSLPQTTLCKYKEETFLEERTQFG